MSTSAASVPAVGGSLLAEVARFCSALFAAPKAKSDTAALPARTRLWNLYLKSAGMNSIDPALLAERIVQD
jgi:hypothetical protein